jgi:hypothetical protein
MKRSSLGGLDDRSVQRQMRMRLLMRKGVIELYMRIEQLSGLFVLKHVAPAAAP